MLIPSGLSAILTPLGSSATIVLQSESSTGSKLDENCLYHGSHIANQLVMIAVLLVGQPLTSEPPKYHAYCTLADRV